MDQSVGKMDRSVGKMDRSVGKTKGVRVSILFSNAWQVRETYVEWCLASLYRPYDVATPIAMVIKVDIHDCWIL